MIMLFLFVVLTATLLPPGNAREIQVDLQAPWAHRAVHPVVEVAEFLGEQSSKDFWAFVDNICATPSHIATIDEALTSVSAESLRNVSQLAVTVGVQIVPANVQSILEISSNLGMYRPAVEFYESLAMSTEVPCGAGNAYVLQYPGGQVKCSPQTSKSDEFSASDSAALTDKTVNMPWNHEYPFGPERKLAAYEHSEVQVLYGVVGSSSFCQLHTELR